MNYYLYYHTEYQILPFGLFFIKVCFKCITSVFLNIDDKVEIWRVGKKAWQLNGSVRWRDFCDSKNKGEYRFSDDGKFKIV